MGEMGEKNSVMHIIAVNAYLDLMCVPVLGTQKFSYRATDPVFALALFWLYLG